MISAPYNQFFHFLAVVALHLLGVNCQKNTKLAASVHGNLTCDGVVAYGTILSLVEGLEDINTGRQYLRVSEWTMADHFGQFSVSGTLHSQANHAYLNITHQCIAPDRWKRYHNCYINTNIRLTLDTHGDTQFAGELTSQEFQTNEPKCVLWDYELPSEAYTSRRTYEDGRSK
ncbi:unnamed protein product [Anisakis simplex]|uniref:Transthyretin-like family protein n=1 Tax=Anisakis simplex TaxID=6269 RepID=A0A0M3JXG7_ANISI|nr:unnamed protein product [Anisakis simplex]